MGDVLSQEEINALLGGGATETIDSSSFDDTDSEIDQSALTNEQIDVIGEIGNISMGTSATTLFALLNQKVEITTPKVKLSNFKEISSSYDRPCVGIRVEYTVGIRGANVLILKQDDVKIIANLMMGGNGEIEPGTPLTELDMSAISEAMNQMVGSSSTSMSSLIKRKIDIDTPQAFVLDFSDDSFFENLGFGLTETVVCSSFRMQIGTLIDSEIMQILPIQFAYDIVETLTGGMNDSQPAASSTAASSTPAAAPQPSAPQTPTQAAAPPPQYAQQQAYQQMPPPQYGPQMYSNPQMGVQGMTQQGMYPPPNSYSYSQPTGNPQVVSPAQFQNFDAGSVYQQKENIEIIMDVPLEVTVELGRTSKKIKEILEFSPGTIVELDKLAGEHIDIMVNGKFVAKGEVVVIEENYAVRITDIISVEKRI